ncbi:glutathione peroxidase [Putridiphycobacter roseus]|uniref:Glutathione peroxidase n=1 Tax=Putridiphycobacter roseus TaxID=2219161 RepID=A0A2W1NQ99_9FLAO|nr:glutathione peroxidase [Putridiphycobacter roseus]PZE17812.1 glutathione peroxidase [Putridiphycobacter roseus]
MTKNIYDFEVKNIQSQPVQLSKYKNKPFLIVNTASQCGLTPQFEGLEKLYKTYKDQGFSILGFPCNQFGGQEPGTEKDIQEGCMINYGVSFDMFSKVDVNGETEAPLFTYLKDKKGSLLGKKIKWNFTKFLVDQNGKVIKRYSPITKPMTISKDIEKLLQDK